MRSHVLIYVVMLLMAALAVAPASAQDDNTPRILDASFFVARWNEAKFRPGDLNFDFIYQLYQIFDFWNEPVPFDPYTETAYELDLIIVSLLVEDLDLQESELGDDDDEFYIMVRGFGVLSGPPESVPLYGTSYKFEEALIVDRPSTVEVVIQVVLGVPLLSGPNQLRLRGLIDYDAAYSLDFRVANDESPEISGVFTGVPLYVLESPILAATNPPPVANAGPDQTVEMGSTVTLDGSDSYDGSNVGFDPELPDVFEKDILQYTWEWISGPQRVEPVADPDGHSPVALVTLEAPGTYVYRLLVDDGVNTPPSSDKVTIYVETMLEENRAPSALITGPSAPVPVGETVELSGADSSDPDGDPLTYRWRQTNEIGGPLESDELSDLYQPLAGMDSVEAGWKTTTPGTFYFSLLVTDPGGLSDTDVVTVEVVAAGSGDTSQRQSGLGGADGDITPGGGAAPLGCGASGGVPLAMLPVLFWLVRGRMR